MMKVKELIELLKRQNQSALVLLSSDEEGNCYSPFESWISTGNFDTGNKSGYGVKDQCYSMKEEEFHGPYIILYPR